MQCSDCRYWFTAQSQCRRYAPQPAANGSASASSSGSAHWPSVAADDWCGEFQPAVVSPSDASPRRASAAA